MGPLPVSVPTARGLNLNLHLTPCICLCFLLPNVLSALKCLLFARRCVLPLRQHREHVHRGLAVTGRRNGEASDWHRPSAGSPRLERATGGHELQELPQAKGMCGSPKSLLQPLLTGVSRSNATARDQRARHVRCSTALASMVCWTAERQCAPLNLKLTHSCRRRSQEKRA